MKPEGTDNMARARECATQAERSLREARLVSQGESEEDSKFLMKEAQVYATLAGAYATMAGVGRMIVR